MSRIYVEKYYHDLKFECHEDLNVLNLIPDPILLDIKFPIKFKLKEDLK